jgi:hypothetical protein
MPYLIRYRVVARLQLSHLCFPDTTPRAGCLYSFPICVILIVTTYALVTFHIDRDYTAQHQSKSNLMTGAKSPD